VRRIAALIERALDSARIALPGHARPSLAADRSGDARSRRWSRTCHRRAAGAPWLPVVPWSMAMTDVSGEHRVPPTHAGRSLRCARGQRARRLRRSGRAEMRRDHTTVPSQTTTATAGRVPRGSRGLEQQRMVMIGRHDRCVAGRT
jgi:hypothetical protein